LRLLLVEDDPAFRELLRTTFASVDVEVDEAGDAREASECIERRHPDVVVLDVGLPGLDGVAFCRSLKRDPATRDIRVVLLTGREDVTAADAEADAHLLKPFRPLELLSVVERLASGVPVALHQRRAASDDEQLLLYARDLRKLVALERGQRAVLESAYRDTVAALAAALESKDTGTRQHSYRVQRYALELAAALDPKLAEDPSVEYGFLLHDIGKIGIPDSVLRKAGPLSADEWRLMQTHAEIGAQMLGAVTFLQAKGVEIVRSHHERWGGSGYPHGLRGEEIPLGARIFAVADSLDAMTSNRPYRTALNWRAARREIRAQSGDQFDPDVVDAFCDREFALHEIRREFLLAA
jgi:ribonuclease P protein subunit RPR2